MIHSLVESLYQDLLEDALQSVADMEQVFLNHVKRASTYSLDDLLHIHAMAVYERDEVKRRHLLWTVGFHFWVDYWLRKYGPRDTDFFNKRNTSMIL